MKTATVKKSQRIKMRLHDHPVKHDGTIIEFAPDGSSFVVLFDGPLPATKFWTWNKSIVADKEPVKHGNIGYGDKFLAPDAQLWEVL
jgi:hypothetical protein